MTFASMESVAGKQLYSDIELCNYESIARAARKTNDDEMMWGRNESGGAVEWSKPAKEIRLQDEKWHDCSH